MKKLAVFALTGALTVSLSVTAFAAAAAPTAAKVLINGQEVAFQAYNVEGNNYFKLRDLAVAMDGTTSDFKVEYDNTTKTMVLTSGDFAEEGAAIGAVVETGSKNAVVSSQKVMLDGAEVALKAYNIDGYNYFKLRDLGTALGFDVAWDNTAKVISVAAEELAAEEPVVEEPVIEEEPVVEEPAVEEEEEEKATLKIGDEEEKEEESEPVVEEKPVIEEEPVVEEEPIVTAEEEDPEEEIIYVEPVIPEPDNDNSFSDFEDRVVELVNEARAENGLSPLSVDRDTDDAADVRAEEMTELYDHQRPDGRSCFTALDEAGASYRAAGENIAYGYRTPEDVMDGWMNSPGHRANILNEDFDEIGVGFNADGYYWVQMFIG